MRRMYSILVARNLRRGELHSMFSVCDTSGLMIHPDTHSSGNIPNKPSPSPHVFGVVTVRRMRSDCRDLSIQLASGTRSNSSNILNLNRNTDLTQSLSSYLNVKSTRHIKSFPSNTRNTTISSMTRLWLTFRLPSVSNGYTNSPGCTHPPPFITTRPHHHHRFSSRLCEWR